VSPVRDEHAMRPEEVGAQQDRLQLLRVPSNVAPGCCELCFLVEVGETDLDTLMVSLPMTKL
jgi:hypothetical protein